MSEPLWIEMVGWDRFQHYRDRTPPWIKTYVDLLANDDYLELSGHCRSILHGLWLEYASSHCRLRLDTATLSSRLHLRVTTAHIEALNHAGFLTLSASAPLAPRYQDASDTRARGETEKEKEQETPKPPYRKPKKRVASDIDKIRTMIANGVIYDLVDLNAELAAAGINGDTANELRKLVTTNGVDPYPRIPFSHLADTAPPEDE